MPTSTIPHFLQAGCPSCCPTNGVRALKVHCYHQLRRIRQVRRLVGQDTGCRSTALFQPSYYRDSTAQPLQRVMQQLASSVTNLSARDHVKLALKELYNTPATSRAQNLCLLMRLIHIGQAPEYLTDCVSSVCSTGGRYRLRWPTLRTTFYQEQEPNLCYSGPAAWKSPASTT